MILTVTQRHGDGLTKASLVLRILSCELGFTPNVNLIDFSRGLILDILSRPTFTEKELILVSHYNRNVKRSSADAVFHVVVDR